MTKLNDIINYVSNNNDFYKKKCTKGTNEKNKIDYFPILTRENLQKNRYNMFSNSYKSKYYYSELKKQSSSGSSGVPITVYWDYKDYYLSMLPLWRKRLEYYGIKPSDRFITFTLNAYNVKNTNEIYFLKVNSNMLMINVSLICEDYSYQKIISIINDFKPKWLYIQPYVLEKILNEYKKNNLKAPESLSYIESVGEILRKDLKNEVQSYFNIKVANLYGSEEMNGIAYECPYGVMHVLSDNVKVECLKQGNIENFGEGEAIITSLTNKAMPLIRYNQGDIIELDNDYTCKCGYHSPIIKNIKGRKLDSIVIDKGFEINSFVLLEVISEINNILNYIILEYKYEYIKKEKKLKCLVRLSEDKKKWFATVKNTIFEVFNNKIPISKYITLEVMEINDHHDYSRKHKILTIIE